MPIAQRILKAATVPTADSRATVPVLAPGVHVIVPVANSSSASRPLDMQNESDSSGWEDQDEEHDADTGEEYGGSWTSLKLQSLNHGSVNPPVLGETGDLDILTTKIKAFELSRGKKLMVDKQKCGSHCKVFFCPGEPKKERRKKGPARVDRAEAFAPTLVEGQRPRTLPSVVDVAVNNAIESVPLAKLLDVKVPLTTTTLILNSQTEQPSSISTASNLTLVNTDASRNAVVSSNDASAPNDLPSDGPHSSFAQDSSSTNLVNADATTSASSADDFCVVGFVSGVLGSRSKLRETKSVLVPPKVHMSDENASANVAAPQEEEDDIFLPRKQPTASKVPGGGCPVFYKIRCKLHGWTLVEMQTQHDSHCVCQARVPVKLAASVSAVRLVVLGRDVNSSNKQLEDALEQHLPHKVDAVLCSRIVTEVERQHAMEQQEEYKLLAAWSRLTVEANSCMTIVLGAKIHGGVDNVRLWRGSENGVEEIALDPLKESDNATFGFLFILNPHSMTLSEVIQPLLGLDGSFCPFFGQLLHASARANGHNIPLAALFCSKENAEHYRLLLRTLFASVPKITEINVTVVSDRDKGLKKAVEESQGFAHKIAVEVAVEKCQAQLSDEKWGIFSSQVIENIELQLQGLPKLSHVHDWPHLIRNILDKAQIPEQRLWDLFLEEGLHQAKEKLARIDADFAGTGFCLSDYLSTMEPEAYLHSAQIQKKIAMFGWRSSGPGEQINRDLKSTVFLPSGSVRLQHVPRAAISFLEYCAIASNRFQAGLDTFASAVVVNWLRADQTAETETMLAGGYVLESQSAGVVTLRRRIALLGGGKEQLVRVDLSDKSKNRVCDACHIFEQEARPCPEMMAALRLTSRTKEELADRTMALYHSCYQRMELVKAHDASPPIRIISLANVPRDLAEPLAPPPKPKTRAKRGRGRPSNEERKHQRIMSRGENKMKARPSARRRPTKTQRLARTSTAALTKEELSQQDEAQLELMEQSSELLQEDTLPSLPEAPLNIENVERVLGVDALSSAGGVTAMTFDGDDDEAYDDFIEAFETKSENRLKRAKVLTRKGGKPAGVKRNYVCSSCKGEGHRSGSSKCPNGPSTRKVSVSSVIALPPPVATSAQNGVAPSTASAGVV